MSTPRRPSRSASIPIPGASGRSLNDLLNFNNLSPPTTSAGAAPSTSPRQQQRPGTSSRYLYSGLEGTRPLNAPATHLPATVVGSAGSSSGLGSSAGPMRHPLGGGTGGPWAASRSVSTASTLMTGGAGPQHHNQHRRVSSGQIPRVITGFEPRIVNGTTPTPPSAHRHGATSTPDIPQPGTPRSPARRRESHDGLGGLYTYAPPISPGRPRRSAAYVPPSPQHHEVSHAQPLPLELSEAGHHKVVTQSTLSRQASPFATSGPTPFSRPSYLQYSALREFIHADESSSSQSPIEKVPLQYTGQNVGRPSSSSAVRDATPFTESDEESESSTGYASRVRHPSGIQGREGDRGRLRDRQSAYANSTTTGDTLVLKVPTKWNEYDRNQFIKISEDGRNVYFHGPNSQGERDAAAVRADYSVPPACGIYYFEVTVMDKGNKGHISVGFSTKSVRLSRLPGWEKESWGYHGDDGHSFASEREGTPFGPKFTTGDVIGCGIDFSLYKAFYTKNGTFLGYAFENVGRAIEVYPSIGLRTSGESIRANFGQDVFRYDIDYHVHRARELAWAHIQSTTVKWSIDDARDIFTMEADKDPSSSKGATSQIQSMPGSSGTNIDVTIKNESDAKVKQEDEEEAFVPIVLPPDFSKPLDKVVLSYLHHHGYEKTALALQAQQSARRKLQMQVADTFSKKESVDVDIKMETEDDLSSTSTRGIIESPFDLRTLDGVGDERAHLPDSVGSRQRIVSAIVRGDIDSVLQMTQEEFPAVLEANEGLMRLKLRCQKFVELMIKTSDALKKTKTETPHVTTVEEDADAAFDYVEISENDTAMDVDGEDLSTTPIMSTNGFAKDDTKNETHMSGADESRYLHRTQPSSQSMADYQRALRSALAYGRKLHSDYSHYSSDRQPEVQALLRKTFSLVMYNDPTTAASRDVAELVSQDARAQLGQEMNQAILESQGRPSRPALERIYRQAAATVRQLALWGVGEAAFADVRKEFGETTV